jgi:hypothetical protein
VDMESASAGRPAAATAAKPDARGGPPPVASGAPQRPDAPPARG